MTTLTTEDQQAAMRHAFRDGAPGVLVSGLVWVAAAVVCTFFDINRAVWTLLIGGALIHPISTALTKATGRPGNAKGNVLNQLAMASTVWLILCCAMAYGLYLLQPALFFPAMMATIGSRYLVFASVYGRATFWVMGASLIAAAGVAWYFSLPAAIVAGLGGVIEMGFAAALFSRAPALAAGRP